MSTLQYFNVPLDGQRGNIMMPKPKNRFRLRVFNFGPILGGIEFTQNVASMTEPGLTHPEQEVHSYNSTAYYAGKHNWSTFNVTLRDDITNSVLRLVGHQMQKQTNHLQQTSALAGSNYKFDMKLDAMDGAEGVLATKHFEGCFVQSWEGTDWDFSTSDPATIQLTIRPDNVIVENGLFPVNPELTTGFFIN